MSDCHCKYPKPESVIDFDAWAREVGLVVIDPNDRKQVERLVKACPADWNFEQDEETLRDCIDGMQAALHEYANPTPPKPEEPTGLGAVVEAEDGRRWVRSKQITTVCHWKPAHGGRRIRWSDLPNSVRVLSDGVTP